MLPDRVSNPGPLTYESGALPIALRGPARNRLIQIIWVYKTGKNKESHVPSSKRNKICSIKYNLTIRNCVFGNFETIFHLTVL